MTRASIILFVSKMIRKSSIFRLFFDLLGEKNNEPVHIEFNNWHEPSGPFLNATELEYIKDYCVVSNWGGVGIWYNIPCDFEEAKFACSIEYN